MNVEKTIEFLLDSQAKHEVKLARLEAVVEKLADNVVRLDEVMVILAESGIAAQKRIDQLGVRMDQLGERFDLLVSAVGVIAARLPPATRVARLGALARTDPL